VNAAQLTAAIPAEDIASAGTASVTVVSPAPGGGTSNAVTFVAGNPVPVIRELSPYSAAPGGPEFALTVNGAYFISSSVVRWNGADRPTTVVSATQLTAAISAADIAALGLVHVTVFSPEPVGGTSNTATFAVGAARRVYLSLVHKPPVPAAPVLNAIANADGDGNYSILGAGLRHDVQPERDDNSDSPARRRVTGRRHFRDATQAPPALLLSGAGQQREWGQRVEQRGLGDRTGIGARAGFGSTGPWVLRDCRSTLRG
jgi:hypothetical protein